MLIDRRGHTLHRTRVIPARKGGYRNIDRRAFRRTYRLDHGLTALEKLRGRRSRCAAAGERQALTSELNRNAREDDIPGWKPSASRATLNARRPLRSGLAERSNTLAGSASGRGSTGAAREICSASSCAALNLCSLQTTND